MMVEVPLEETALQLFGRVEQRPSLIGLNKTLFPNGPQSREVIEITGDPGSGKSIIILDLLAKCLLPTSYDEMTVGGLASGALVLCTEKQFSALRLVRFMEVRVRRRLRNIADDQIKKIVSLSLKRLSILHALDEDEFDSALAAIKADLALRRDVSLLVLDGAAAHFRSSVARGEARRMDTFIENRLNSVDRALGSFQITLIYTRPLYFFTKSALPLELSTTCNLKAVNVQIRLKPHRQSDWIAQVQSGTSVHIAFYDITDNGIEWSK